MSRKTIEVDSDMIDRTLEELADSIRLRRKRGRNITLLRKFKRFEIRYKIPFSMQD
jgi:hypothetical protein